MKGNSWKGKTLETLERDFWPPIETDDISYLALTLHTLRKKPLKNLNIEDLRVMIGQNMGLPFLIPLAMEELKFNILAQGELYPGDLLCSVLNSDIDYWKEEEHNWQLICHLIEFKKQELIQAETTGKIQKTWFEAYSRFQKIN